MRIFRVASFRKNPWIVSDNHTDFFVILNSPYIADADIRDSTIQLNQGHVVTKKPQSKLWSVTITGIIRVAGMSELNRFPDKH